MAPPEGLKVPTRMGRSSGSRRCTGAVGRPGTTSRICVSPDPAVSSGARAKVEVPTSEGRCDDRTLTRSWSASTDLRPARQPFGSAHTRRCGRAPASTWCTSSPTTCPCHPCFPCPPPTNCATWAVTSSTRRLSRLNNSSHRECGLLAARWRAHRRAGPGRRAVASCRTGCPAPRRRGARAHQVRPWPASHREPPAPWWQCRRVGRRRNRTEPSSQA